MNILLYLLTLLVPFSQSIPFLHLGNGSINLGMDTVLIAVIVVCYSLKIAMGSERRLWIGSSAKLLVAWLLWNTATVIGSAIYLQSNDVLISLVNLLKWAQYVPIFIILTNGELDYPQCKKAVILTIIAGLLGAGLGIYQTFQGIDPRFKGAPSFTIPLFREHDISAQLSDSGLYQGSANYNVVGAYLLIALMMLAPFVLSTCKRYMRALGFFFMFVLVAGILTTASRISIITCVVCLLYASYLWSKKCFFNNLFLFILIGIISLVFFRENRIISDLLETATKLPQTIPLVFAGKSWGSEQATSSTVFGAAQRLVGYWRALQVFTTNPISGVGFSAFLHFSDVFAENFFLQMLAETGIVGFLLMLLFFASLIGSASKSLKIYDSFTQRYRIGFLATILAMILVNMTGGIFYSQKVWGAFLILSGVWYAIKRAALHPVAQSVQVTRFPGDCC